jgi:anaerobic magnesium-protoporphyrin IX monomethyl ester cyclase
MKLLLVNPNFDGVVIVPSLGLGFLGTYIREQSDCDVEIVESIQHSISQTQALEKAKDADIVGLVCYTESRFQCFDFADQVKQINPACQVIVGGPHVNTLDELIIRHYPSVDAVVRMEGEETLLGLVQGRPFEQILGITWRKHGEIIRNPDRPLIQNINQFHYDYGLAFPQFADWKDTEIAPELQKLRAIPIIASRGCPFQCTFCAAHQQWAKVYRGVSPEELVARIQYLVNEYQIGYFRFYDALFIGNEKYILKFCDLLEQAGLEIHFRIDIRVGTRPQVLERLRKVGCDVVGFGVESGSDRVLQRVRKGTNRTQIEETIAVCKALGYWIIGFFMVSLPDETLDDVHQTFELFKFFDYFNLQFYKIHPNTAFYQELKQKGEINDEAWFDRTYGYQTQYGHEVYYCKELFPSANFSLAEGNALVGYADAMYHVTHPAELIRVQGWKKGTGIFLFAALMCLVLRWEQSRKLYRRFKQTRVYQFVKRISGRTYEKSRLD